MIHPYLSPEEFEFIADSIRRTQKQFESEKFWDHAQECETLIERLRSFVTLPEQIEFEESPSGRALSL